MSVTVSITDPSAAPGSSGLSTWSGARPRTRRDDPRSVAMPVGLRRRVLRALVVLRRARPVDTPTLERHAWGTVLRASDRPSMALHLTQWIVWVFAVTLLAGGISLMLSGWGDAVRLVAGLVLSLAAIPFLGFASRGSVAEVHLDREAGLVSELVMHRVGAPTILSQHRLADVLGVTIVTHGPHRHRLSLRLRDGDTLAVAQGSMADLSPMVAEIESAMLSAPAPIMRQPCRAGRNARGKVARAA